MFYLSGLYLPVALQAKYCTASESASLVGSLKRVGGVIGMLLGRDDAASSTGGKYGRTPPLWAAGNGYVDIEKARFGGGVSLPETPIKAVEYLSSEL